MEVLTKLEEQISLLLEEFSLIKSERDYLLAKQVEEHNRLLQENKELQKQLEREQGRNLMALEKVQRIVDQLKKQTPLLP